MAKDIKESRLFHLMLEKTLATEPSKAGMKLMSHRQIASMMDINPSRTRTSMEKLEREGVLVRSPRIGTYVRKIPRLTSEHNKIETFRPEQIFKEIKSEQDLFADAGGIGAQLNIGFWGKLEGSIEGDRKMLSALARAVDNRGHKLVVHSVFDDEGFLRGKPPKYLIDNIRKSPCDGYLVVSEWSDLYLETFNNMDVPVVYFLAGSPVQFEEPIICFDTNNSVDRAVLEFVREGYKHIGLICYNRGLFDTEPEQWYYRKSMAQAGIDYEATAKFDLDENNIAGGVCDFLKSPNRPDAVYISDDYILREAVKGFEMAGLKAGKDIAVIVLSNKGLDLPAGCNWSRFEFDHYQLAEVAVDNLLNILLTTDQSAKSLSLYAHWKPGSTHRKSR